MEGVVSAARSCSFKDPTSLQFFIAGNTYLSQATNIFYTQDVSVVGWRLLPFFATTTAVAPFLALACQKYKEMRLPIVIGLIIFIGM